MEAPSLATRSFFTSGSSWAVMTMPERQGPGWVGPTHACSHGYPMSCCDAARFNSFP